MIRPISFSGFAWVFTNSGVVLKRVLALLVSGLLAETKGDIHAVGYWNTFGRMRFLSDTYKSSACDILIGKPKPDSSIIIVHISNMSSSHGTALRNLQLSLQLAKSSVSGRRRSSARHRWGARYMRLGIPDGTLMFLEGRMRCAFQTSLISFKSSCKIKGKEREGVLHHVFA